MDAPLALLCDQLVDAIRKYGVHDENILHAFRIVPRHEFIASFFNRNTDNPRQWHLVSPVDPCWLGEIYTDRPLTISLDENGDPNASSSQPNLMALMMQSVSIQPGQRVLEIGTGTGYNAALLASIVGAENVVSIDINAALISAACERIERIAGPGVMLLHLDGLTLPDLGQFDAIIVAAAHSRFEPSWVNALSCGGRIVMNLQLGLLSKVMIEAQRSESGLVGRVCSYGGDFMPLHGGMGTKPLRSPFPRLGLVGCEEFRPQIEDQDFLFFLHLHLPQMVLSRYRNKAGERSYALKDSCGCMVLFAPFRVRGDASLWEAIQALSTQFEALGRPSRASFHFRVTTEGCIEALSLNCSIVDNVLG